ncbi:MAG: o-succinylbenzoate synthase [Leptolyngbyaceae cyanobacterium]
MEWTNLLNRSIPNSVYQVDYRPYRWPFRVPLHTGHGTWSERQGIIVCVSNQQGQVGYGEIAPLPWFGSETLEQALAWCKRLRSRSRSSGIPGPDLLAIPDTHPACQFGLESAIATSLSPRFPQPEPADLPHCYLLPTGAIALQSWQPPWQTGSRTFKWKIGVTSITQELVWFKQLVQTLPSSAILRLDANGGLNWDTACQWLETCDRLTAPHHATVEFLEQPLPPSQLADIFVLSQQFQTAIALDESVATFQQLQACYQQGWRGIVVIKAAIAGFPSRLLQFCQEHQIDMVWSSVFETAIARQFILGYMVMLSSAHPRAIGFGVDQWVTPIFAEDSNAEQIWMSLIR